MFVIVIPIFCWYILRKVWTGNKTGKILAAAYAGKIFVIVFITAAVTVIANKMVTSVSAPYTESTIATIISQIGEQGIYHGLCFFMDNFFQNLSTVDLFSIFSLSSDTYGILSWFYINYLIILFILLFDFVKNRKSFRQNRTYYYEAIFLLAGFLVGYCALYTGSSWTLCRGINTGLIMAMIYLCFTEKERLEIMIFLLTLFEITSVWRYYDSMANERFTTSLNRAVIEEEREKLAKVIELDTDADTWENTVANYGNMDCMHLALPAGYGANYMVDMEIMNTKARYALVTQGQEYTVGIVEKLEETGHKVLFEDAYFAILEHENTGEGRNTYGK